MNKATKLKIMAAGLTISILGCAIVKNSPFSCISSYKDKTIITFDEVEPNSIFFHKTIRDTITLQDIILTMEERGIQENTSLQYQQIVDSIEEDSFAIQELHIEENLSSAFLSSSVTNISCHQNHTLYDSKNDTILWEKVGDIWIKNSEERVKLDKQYFMFSHSESLYLELTSLETDKIQTLVYQMQEFIAKTKEEIPNLNIQRVACQLEEMSFCYTNHTYNNVLLVSEDFTLLFPTAFGTNLDIPSMKKHLFHEFKHMIATPCEDEIKNQLYYPSQTGVYTLNSNHRNLWYYLPFDWIFLEEAGAETFSSELVEQIPITYQTERQLQQDMLLSISFTPNFDKNIFVKCSLLHNPIALLQQFPIPNSNQEKWLYQNAKMIECYNILSNHQAFLNYILNIEEKEEYQNIFKRQNGEFSKQAQEFILSLEDTADLQLMRIFLVNIMNSKRTLTQQDYYYFYHLMDMRIQNHRNAILGYYGITLENKDYFEKKEALLQNYIKYLNIKFQKDISWKYENNLEEYQLSTNFSEKEQIYYKELAQNITTSSTLSEKEPIDKILAYYLGE